MSHYKNQEFDFISRTKRILEQYENFKLPTEERFEVTLLLNCLVGLLILPQQHWFNKLPTSIVSQNEWGIKEEFVVFIKTGEEKSVKNIARHIRNSISHYRFKAFQNKSGEIVNIMFDDYDKQKNKTFEANLPIDAIKKFVTQLTDYFVKKMSKLS